MGNGSMAEGLYGLQRSRLFPRSSAGGGGGGGGGESTAAGVQLAASVAALSLTTGNRAASEEAAAKRRRHRISRRQRVLSVLLLVGVPYCRDKLDKLHSRLSGRRDLVASAATAAGGGSGARSNLGGGGGFSSAADAIMGDTVLGVAATGGGGGGGGGEDRFEVMGGEDVVDNINSASAAAAAALDSASDTLTAAVAAADRRSVSRGSGELVSLRSIAETAFVRAYPYVHAGWEAVVFFYWLRYLLGGGDVHDPVLRALQLCVVRTSPAEMAETQAQIDEDRRRTIAASRASPSFLRRVLGTAGLRATHFAIDYAQGGLMAAVVGFKLMEWWYGTAEERLQQSATLPVPPPPPKPQPHPRGVRVPDTASACPLCLRVCVQPAMATPSGYVFCHQCLRSHVERHGRCPVTLTPMRRNGNDIRRLFDTT